MSLTILKPGLLTTVQDTGRYGYQQSGMVVSGAMDAVALRLANLLVGNLPYEAGLEMTLQGPTLRFDHPCLIALTGADLSPKINGQPVGMWRLVYVNQGCVLSFGKRITGCRTYLAVAGGLKVPPVMGSRSTYLRGGVGGWQGRALQAGDVLPQNNLSPQALSRLDIWQRQPDNSGWEQAAWMPDPQLYDYNAPVIRVVRGPEYHLFTAASQQQFWQTAFTLATQSDRMGYRLEGASLVATKPVSLLSTAVTFGTVQVPPDGNPIILMADRQTTGGYPIIGQIATVDLPVLAQRPPGAAVKFVEISLQDAQHLYIQREKKMAQLSSALKFKP